MRLWLVAMTALPRRQYRLFAAAMMVAASFCYMLMSGISRSLGHDVPTGQIVFFRAGLAMLPVFAWLAWRGRLKGCWRTTRPVGHLLRSIFGGTSLYLHFAALAWLPLAEVSAINYLVPILIVLLASLVLGERIWGIRLIAVAVGFLGAAAIIAPKLGDAGGDAGEAYGALLVFASTVLTAAAMIQIRRLSATEQTGTIVLYFSLAVVTASLTTIPFGWVALDASQAARLIAIGLIGGVAQILMTESYAKADASFVAPFEYAGILWAIALGVAFFGEAPGVATLIGAAIVLAAGILLAWGERRATPRMTTGTAAPSAPAAGRSPDTPR
jgi:drug/metabolite transporter (DMT)-like permease